MHYISKAIEQLRQRLLSIDCSSGGSVQIVENIASQHKESLLDWLNRQTIFPSFYWCHRNNSEEVVACGAVITFDDIYSANTFVCRHPHTDMRIWGLNAFDQLSDTESNRPKGCLFLPRVEISNSLGNLRITVNLYDPEALGDDIQRALATLAQIDRQSQEIQFETRVLSVVDQPQRQQWCELLEKALACIARGEFDKVVMARKTTLTLAASLDPVQFMTDSKRVNHDCFHFMMRFNAERTFLGSSPERLFYRSGYRLVTEALAGTVASAEDDVEARKLGDWLMRDEKNQHENSLVVDDISQRLAPHVKKISVQDVEIVRLRKVQHLRRGIHAELNYINDVDCLHWLQPTAAVAGLPRQPALHFILQNEPFDREWYAGSAGYISYKESEFSVSLRSALIECNHICLYAGAGIVAGSEPLHEWLEIENKAAGLRTLLK